jgi:hypothetical protein
MTMSDFFDVRSVLGLAVYGYAKQTGHSGRKTLH